MAGFLPVVLGLGVAFLALLLGVFLVAVLGVLAAGFLPVLAAFLVAVFFTCRANQQYPCLAPTAWHATES